MTRPVVITLFVRHAETCKYRGDEFTKRCNCRKHFRWRASNGVQHRRAAGTRSWTEAEVIKRDLEDQLSGRKAPDVAETVTQISAAVTVFLQDKKVQGVTPGVLAKHTRELARLVDYCARRKTYAVQGLTRELLTGYAATWADSYPSTQTRQAVRTRLRSFLRYCYEAQWVERVPALPKIAVDEPPTMPLTEEEMAALLAAARSDRERALVLLMRWTGLAISDSLKLPRTALQYVKDIGKWRVQTSRQKTGTHVEVVVPDVVADTLLALVRVGPRSEFFFWDGVSDIVKTWTKYMIAPMFKKAGILKAGNMTSHRLRDTFACYYLEKGVPLQDVSKMLGHESIKTTERSYAKWVKSRQARLDSVVMEAWAA
ncbi:MAG TPA: tyrosine-type recombinase/integrase [Acidobacteriaceae bacterium]|jgi:integrase/recombinase XerD|nr:tyrosine-type recombinase/integrase [Acidobacteriaceae bacterium]